MTDKKKSLLQKALFNNLSESEHQMVCNELSQLPDAYNELELLRSTALLLQNTPAVAAPGDLQRRIMTALPSTPPPMPALVNLQRCAFYFIVAGLFHFILGSALFAAFHDPNLIPALTGWPGKQPQILLATGVFFLLSGGVLFFKKENAARGVYAALICYLLFVAANGFALHLTLPAPPLFMGLVAFIGASLTIGFLLGTLVHKHCLEVHNG